MNGYLQEVYGPQAVASAIRNGFADAGMWTSSVARANGLRFVPLAHEDYELASGRRYWKTPVSACWLRLSDPLNCVQSR